MKRISAMIIFIMMGTGVFAQGRSVLGIDIGDMMRNRRMNISAGYGFSDRWSASWKVEIDTDAFATDNDSEYNAHLGEFIGTKEKSGLPCSCCLSVRYWPVHAYEGLYLETGCRYTEDIDTDCIIGAGYFIPITKGLKLALSYETCLTDRFRENRQTGPGITLGLFLIIRK